MTLKVFSKKVHDLNAIFNGHYIEVKAFYAWQFNKLPCVNFVGEIDVSNAFKYVNETYQYSIRDVYQHAWLDHKEDRFLFNNTIFVLQDSRMIELANDYCQLLFTPKQYGWAMQVARDIAGFKKTTEAKDVRVMGFARQPEAN